MAQALIPGSFDPITVGHMDVITRASWGFDLVYVAVMSNDMHKYVEGVTPKQYMFSMEEREAMVSLACRGLDNVKVITAGGMLIELVDRLGVDFIVKGIRNAQDFAYEQTHALWNRAHNPRAETLYLPADPAYDGISSTLVRERIVLGQSLSDTVPQAVINWIMTHPRA